MNLRTRRNIVTGFFIAMMVTGLFLTLLFPSKTVLAEEDKTATDSSSFLTIGQDVTYPDLQQITVPFYSFQQYSIWDFPYSDYFFTQSSDTFQTELAKASIGLAVSAFRNDEKEDLDNQLTTYLGGAGFSDIYSFGYDQPTAEDTISAVIAHKKIGDFTLVATAVCGQGYKNEWAGNLKVGTGERHEGFNQAAQIVEAQLARYIEEHDIQGDKKLWITGFSRAAAVSNLTAADVIESGEFEDVYAYLFGVPRTTKKPVAYQGIYNICGGADPVPMFPMESWGFYRYGTDIFTPTQEVNSAYASLIANADPINRVLCGTKMYNNPYVHYQLRLIVEYLAELFPTSDDYAQKFQADLMAVWKEANPDHISEILTEALSQIDNLDNRQERATDVIIDYVSLIASEQLRGNQEQVKNGLWNEDDSIGANYFREHMPYTYIDWLFSENDPEEIYAPGKEFRRVVLVGPIDVFVYKNDELVSYITKDGTVTHVNEWMENDYYQSEVFLKRSGKETMVSLPMDEDYSLEMVMYRSSSLSYYQVITPQEELFAASGEIHVCSIKPGYYCLTFDRTEALPELEVIDGDIIRDRTSPYKYSPFLLMSSESTNKFHITLDFILKMSFWFLAFLLALGLVCLVIFIVHAIRGKKRERPYSRLYVVIPHVLLIAVFAILTQFATLNLYSVSIAARICATLNVFFIFLLALRGLLRTLRSGKKEGYIKKSGGKTIVCLIYALLLLALTVVTYFFYMRSTFADYTFWKSVLYYLIIAVLTVGSVLLFPKRTRKAKHLKQDDLLLSDGN